MGKRTGKLIWKGGVVVALLCAAPTAAPDDTANGFVQQGVAVKFAAEPLAASGGNPSPLVEGGNALLSFTISDATTKEALKGLRPAVWLDRRKQGQAVSCKDKITTFLQGRLALRPDVDLNAYYVLTLSDQASISVIDPQMGFGQSKLIARIVLPGVGEDWALSGDGKQLFVTVPKTGQVAVVNTATWAVEKLLPAGANPSRAILQPDQRYLWVGNDGDAGGVTVVDTEKLAVAAHINTGRGRHDIAFSDDSRYGYVTNERDGKVTLIDVPKLARVAEIKSGASPVSLAFSRLSGAVYVVSAQDGAITVLEGARHKPVSALAARPGLKSIRFTPDGRWGLVTNARDNTVTVVDASSNRIVNTLQVGSTPDQVVFTNTHAYVRSLNSEQVSLIRLSSLGQAEAVAVSQFPAGNTPPGQTSDLAMAATMAAAPEGNAVLVANPADKSLYYYAEGMAAPMGSLQNYGQQPRAVLVVDRGLKETAPGSYRAQVTFPGSGLYDVAFLLDNPRVAACFTAQVEANPQLKKSGGLPAIVEFVGKQDKMAVGQPAQLIFTLSDPQSGRANPGLKDVRVLSLLAPGIWQDRQMAHPLEDGTYRVTFTPPRSGIYYVFVESPSLGLQFQQSPHLSLPAR